MDAADAGHLTLARRLIARTRHRRDGLLLTLAIDASLGRIQTKGAKLLTARGFAIDVAGTLRRLGTGIGGASGVDALVACRAARLATTVDRSRASLAAAVDAVGSLVAITRRLAGLARGDAGTHTGIASGVGHQRALGRATSAGTQRHGLDAVIAERTTGGLTALAAAGAGALDTGADAIDGATHGISHNTAVGSNALALGATGIFELDTRCP